MNHDQIQRIKTKLERAKKADKSLKVFGAKSHKYQIGRPASEREVCAFEERYSLTLPGCYRSFLTGVGNGGPSYSGSAAGPYYGIYPLGKSVDELLENAASFLSKPALIKPGMSEKLWARVTRRINESGISDEKFQEERGRLYAGLLPIGSQGCTYLHALVLNGPHAGKVVNLDLDWSTPKFAFEKNFLDWYERWLDEVISGDLIQDMPTGFGYTMGGDDQHLMRVYAEANCRETRIKALQGLAKLRVATENSCRTLLELCGEGDDEIRHLALRMLTKFSYAMSREQLRTHIAGDDNDRLVACQSIISYAKERSKEWVDQLGHYLPKVNAPETFRFISYILVESNVDFSEALRPICTHENEDIRATAFYSLGKLNNKKDLVDLFIVGLDDASPKVVLAALQALPGVRNRKLLDAYARLVERFKTEEYYDYVLTNLEHRLKEMGFRSIEEFKKRR